MNDVQATIAIVLQVLEKERDLSKQRFDQASQRGYDTVAQRYIDYLAGVAVIEVCRELMSGAAKYPKVVTLEFVKQILDTEVEQ